MPDAQAAVRRCYRVVASTMIGAAILGALACLPSLAAVEANSVPAVNVTAAIAPGLTPAQTGPTPSAEPLTIVPLAKPSGLIAMQDTARPVAASEVNCLAEAVYFEARGEPWQGQRAVAEVVLRRARTQGYPRTICGVVYQGDGGADCQFSFACDGSSRTPHEPEAWRKALDVAQYQLSGAGRFDDLTGGALYFHVASLRAGWSHLQRTVEIGNHVFYRDPGAVTEARAQTAAAS